MGQNRILKIILYLFPLIVIVSIYSLLLKGFFVQDEWYSFGLHVLYRNLNFVDSLKFFFSPSIGHYNPFTNIIEFWLFSIWGLDYVKFAVLGIILHVLVVVSVFFLAKRFFHKKVIWPLLAAFIFGVFASIYQGVSWVVVDIATLMASLFGIISTILLLDFLVSKKNINLILSLVFLFCSLFFKEITIGLFPLYFLLIWLSPKKKFSSKCLFIVILTGLGYLLFRACMFFVPSVLTSNVVTQSLPLNYLIYNFLTIPLKSLSQILIPSEIIKFLSQNIALLLPRNLTGAFQTTAFDRFVEDYIMEGVSLGISLLVILYSYLFFKKEKKREVKVNVLFCFAWIAFNSYIFSFSPNQTGTIKIVDSRNLYFVSIGVAILLIFVVKKLYDKKNKWFFVLLFSTLLLNIYFLWSNLSSYTKAGELRRNILQQVTDYYPRLSNNTIFYIESDRSFYGLPEDVKILPFQSGFGQTLLAWYENRQGLPPEFFEDSFLWDIESQGYKKVSGIGVGYFRDFKFLADFVKKNNLPVESVIGFRYASRSMFLSNITDNIRLRLKNGVKK